jgi:hypothetical protein
VTAGTVLVGNVLAGTVLMENVLMARGVSPETIEEGL